MSDCVCPLKHFTISPSLLRFPGEDAGTDTAGSFGEGEEEEEGACEDVNHGCVVLVPSLLRPLDRRDSVRTEYFQFRDVPLAVQSESQ